MNAPRYWIQLPADGDWNVPLQPNAVIEGHVEDDQDMYKNLVFTGPPELTARHRSMQLHHYGGFAEVAGPARVISQEEWVQLVISVQGRRATS